MRLKLWMRLHIGTDTLQKPSNGYKGDDRMKIKKIVLLTMLITTIFSLTGCGKSYEKKIEEKYGIEIETDDKDDLKKVDTYFSKLPKGFIEELKKYDDYDNRTIKIVLKKSYDEQTRVKYDISTGDCWYIDSSQDLEDQISYCVIQSVIFNMVNRKDRDGLLLKWNDFNPEDYKYGDDDKYAEYFYGNTSKENAYFIDPKPLQSAGDDATTIFILLMKSDYDLDDLFKNSPKICDKAKYLCEEIERAFETVDETAYWNRYFT